MGKGKLITYWIFMLLSVMSVIYSYTVVGVDISSIKAYALAILTPMMLIFGLMVGFLLVSLSHVTPRAVAKKNLLRVSLIVNILIFIVTVVIAIRSYMAGWFCISCVMTSLFLLVMIIVNMTMLKELYNLIHELIHK